MDDPFEAALAAGRGTDERISPAERWDVPVVPFRVYKFPGRVTVTLYCDVDSPTADELVQHQREQARKRQELWKMYRYAAVYNPTLAKRTW